MATFIQLCVVIEPEQLQRLDSVAAREMRTRSNLVRLLLAEGLSRRAREVREPETSRGSHS